MGRTTNESEMPMEPDSPSSPPSPSRKISIPSITFPKMSPPPNLFAEILKNAMPPDYMSNLLKWQPTPELARQIQAIVASAQAALEPMRKVFDNLGPMFLNIAKAMEGLPEELKIQVVAAANEGWFFDPNMGIDVLRKAGNAFRAGDRETGDAIIAEHFRSRVDEIEIELCQRLPHRAPKFKSSINAHRAEIYDLSVLGFFAQADGVCKELRGGYFFLSDRKTRSRETAAYADESISNDFDKFIYAALKEQLPLMTQMKHLSEGSNILNRHEVMHGRSLDYDTELNSLKAMSLLNYVALGMDDDSPETEPSAL